MLIENISSASMRRSFHRSQFYQGVVVGPSVALVVNPDLVQDRDSSPVVLKTNLHFLPSQCTLLSLSHHPGGPLLYLCSQSFAVRVSRSVKNSNLTILFDRLQILAGSALKKKSCCGSQIAEINFSLLTLPVISSSRHINKPDYKSLSPD